MGQCTWKKKPSPSSVGPTEVLDSNEILRFQISVGDFAVSGMPESEQNYCLFFSCFENTRRTSLKTGGALKWQEEWTFAIESTQKFIWNQRFAVKVEKSGGEKVASQEIPLWDIVVGPSLQSWNLKGEKGKTNCRFRADIKVQQVTLLLIKPIRILSHFSEPQYGMFSLTIKYAGENEQETKHSDIEETLEWMNIGKQLSFEVPMTVNLIHTGALQFRIWKHYPKGETQAMIAECWLGLNKILKAERQELFTREVTRISHHRTMSLREADTTQIKALREVEKRIESAMWFGGRQVGKMEGVMRIAGIPYITQLNAGVLTDHGILFPYSDLNQLSSEPSPRQSSFPPSLLSVASLFHQLQDYVSQYRESLINPRNEASQKHERDLTAMVKELREYQRDSVFLYNNENELIEGQNLMLDLGEFLLEYADRVVLGSGYYQCLTCVCKRAELDLGHLSLDRSFSSSIQSQKVAIGVRYWAFLKRLLARALSKLNEKGAEMRVREYTEHICAIAYFRMSEFRETLLECLKEKSYGQVEEWRGTTYDLEDDVRVHPWSLPMFDWDRYFTAYLPKDFAGSLDKSILSNPAWKKRISKRGLAYFRFISQWTENVSRSFVQKHVPWHDIPGYHVIVKSFLLELKERPVRSYPDAMLKASTSLLKNPHLISIFILILFKKTNVNDKDSVKETIANTSNWLTFLYESGFPLPMTFPDAFFIQGLKTALNSDVMMNTACTLWLLYKVYQVLHQEIREEVVLNSILGDQSIALAFHWSKTVRVLFWEFLLYRVVSMKTIPMEQVTNVDQMIMQRADELITLIESDSPAIPASPSLYFDPTPYILHSKEEFKAQHALFVLWLYNITPSFGSSRKGKYGPFEEFPYPNLLIPRAPEDPVDCRISETLSPIL